MPTIIFPVLLLLGWLAYQVIVAIWVLFLALTMPWWDGRRMDPKIRAMNVRMLETEARSLEGVPVCLYTGFPGHKDTEIMFVVGVDKKELKLVTNTGLKASRGSLVDIRTHPMYCHLYPEWLRKQQESRQ